MGKIITQLDMFRNADAPMRGNKSSTFGYAGGCFTAQAVVVHPEAMDGLNIVSAQWRICWLPNIDNGAQTVVRLVWSDAGVQGEGSSNYIHAFSSVGKTNSPQNDGVYLTDTLKYLIGTHKPSADFPSGRLFQFSIQSAGDGTFGPLIYSSSIELVIET